MPPHGWSVDWDQAPRAILAADPAEDRCPRARSLGSDSQMPFPALQDHQSRSNGAQMVPLGVAASRLAHPSQANADSKARTCQDPKSECAHAGCPFSPSFPRFLGRPTRDADRVHSRQIINSMAEAHGWRWLLPPLSDLCGIAPVTSPQAPVARTRRRRETAALRDFDTAYVNIVLRLAIRDIGHILFVLRSRDQTAFTLNASTILRRQRGLNIIDALPWR